VISILGLETTPVVPIIVSDQKPFPMLDDVLKEHWSTDLITYRDLDDPRAILDVRPGFARWPCRFLVLEADFYSVSMICKFEPEKVSRAAGESRNPRFPQDFQSLRRCRLDPSGESGVRLVSAAEKVLELRGTKPG